MSGRTVGPKQEDPEAGEHVVVCGRDRAVLRAVAAGRCGLSAGCEPVLVVDGVRCADSAVAHRLIVAGLLVPPTRAGGPAQLTAAGRAALGLVAT